MKESHTILNCLLLIHAKDAKAISDSLAQNLKGVPTQAICVDNPVFSSQLLDLANSRLQIVFFSPEFLQFLEWRPDDAFVAFRNINPQTTVATFCNGLREQEVMCYHMAPLNSFNSWPKFEIPKSDNEHNEIPKFLLQTLQEVFSVREVDGNIEIVPEMINKEVNTIFAIFPRPVNEMGNFTVYLEGLKTIQITPSYLNPYVIKFSVPDTLLDRGRSLTVRIQESTRVVAEKRLRVVWDRSSITSFTRKLSLKKSKASLDELLLDEQLRFLSDFANSTEKCLEGEANVHDRFHSTMADPDVSESLTALCKKYGLEELSSLIADQDDSKREALLGKTESFQNNNLKLEYTKKQDDCSNMDRFILNNSLQSQDDEDFGVVKRSLSLPSLLTTQEELDPAYAAYFRMGPIEKSKGCLLGDSLEEDAGCPLLSNGYVYMRWNGNFRDPLQRGLSESQQELLDIMLDFKNGQKTLSDVEKQFHSWKKRHYRMSRMFKEDTPKNSGWKTLIRKKSKRKISKEEDSGNRRNRYVSESSNQTNSRKTSNASATSTSSKTSETSSSTGCSRSYVSTGFVPTYSTSAMCPLYPQNMAPPLPPRPLAMQKTKRMTSSDDNPKPPVTSRRKSSFVLTRSVSRSQNVLDLMDDDERLHTMVTFCEKHGLDDIKDHFLNDFTLMPSEHKDNHVDMGGPNTIESKFMGDEEWDAEGSSGVLHRSLSLPSTLYGSITNKETANDDGSIPRTEDFHRCVQSSNCKCDDCLLTWDSVSSNVYSTLRSQKTSQPNQTLQRSSLSSSQQELLELIVSFKKGQKDISQVEQQMREWNRRHLGESSSRERELTQLKSEYEKAQKSNTSKLQDIKNFILGKPKKKDCKSGMCCATISYTRPIVGKSENDGKRFSKISFTSTSSGISDSSEVFPTVTFHNPSYGQYQGEFSDGLKLLNPTPRLKPPPLPKQAAVSRRLTRQKTIYIDLNENVSTKLADSLTATQTPKPSLPPKPTNLLKKVSTTVEEKGDSDGNPDSRPESPDYITPNAARLFTAQYRKRQMALAAKGQNSLAAPNNPSQPTSRLGTACRKDEIALSIQCPASSQSAKDEKSTFLKIANQLIKPSKKKEESMFYVASKRWSSFPDLRSSCQPIYVELLGPPDRRSKSISESEPASNNNE